MVEHIWNHLVKQGQQSKSTDFCLYRNGVLKCAVGALISDDVYVPALEECGTVYSAPVIDAVEKSIKRKLIDDFEIRLLYHLQCAHDLNDSWVGDKSNLKQKFADAIKEFNSAVPEDRHLSTEFLGM